MSTLSMSAEASALARRYYAYAGVYTLAASVIWGINTLFLLDAGLSVAEVFTANAAFSLGTVVFEIPTGVVADTVGRRTSFLLALLVLASTTLLYVALAAIGAGLAAFAVTSVLMGLGFTFYSGAMEAWLVDGLRHNGYDGDLDSVFSRAQIVSGVAMLSGTVGGGLLGQVDLSLPFLVRSGLLAVLLGLAYRGMHDLGFEPRHMRIRDVPRVAAETAAAGVAFGWRHGSLRLLMVAGAIQSGFFIWAWYAWQPYFLELLERDAVWVAGVVAALLAVSMMIGNGIVDFVARFCGRRTTMLLWSGAVFSAALAGVGLVDAFLPAVMLLFVAGVAIGVQMPVRQAFVHRVVPSRERATVVSFDSMVSGIGGIGGQGGLGALAERRGFSAGYVAGGIVTVVSLPILSVMRRRADPADFFVGRVAVTGCSAQGLPTISSVEPEVPVEVA